MERSDLDAAVRLLVQATSINSYKDLQSLYDGFIALQVAGIVVGAVTTYYLNTYIGIALLLLNVADWLSLEYIMEETSKVLIREGSIVDLI
mmetsp:Transcript_3756/g.6412  ORF Transcript_3756/g.6412 Transcript_3756/m.6412 type:complete len:91 (+) Transcript_3756:16-288(+)